MIDQVTAHHLFEYRDGHLYWKNAVLPSNNGKLAGYDNKNGYMKVTIKNKQYYIHRIIYLMQHGFMPQMIDHIDGNSKNNFNSVYKSKNKSGYRNVFYNKERDTWTIYITINKKTKFFGSYEDVELAGLVAEEARRKYHGEFFTQRGIN